MSESEDTRLPTEAVGRPVYLLPPGMQVERPPGTGVGGLFGVGGYALPEWISL